MSVRRTTPHPLALAILAGLLALLFWLLVSPMLSARAELDASLDVQRRTAARLAALAGQTPAKVSADVQPAVFVAASLPLAAAALQAQLDAVLADAGARTEQLRAEPEEADDSGALRPLRVSATFVATTAQLQRALIEIEAGAPAVAIERFAIQALPPETPTQPDLMRVDITARALAALGGAP